MNGAIIINAYKKPINTLKVAERLQKELSVFFSHVEIIYDALFHLEKLEGLDFVVFLDKDKYLAKIIENKGIKMFNSLYAIDVCDDKGKTSIELYRHNILIPKTMYAPLCFDSNEVMLDSDADIIINNLSLPLVVKESYGSMGKGVYLANNKSQLLYYMNNLKTVPHIYQEYIGYKRGEDIRVIVIGKKVVAYMKRKNEKDFRSNIALGGKGEKIKLEKEYKDIAIKCAKILKLDYCGVDILTNENNKPVICEVNSNAFFSGIEEVTNINVGKIYAQYIYKCMNKKCNKKQ